MITIYKAQKDRSNLQTACRVAYSYVHEKSEEVSDVKTKQSFALRSCRKHQNHTSFVRSDALYPGTHDPTTTHPRPSSKADKRPSLPKNKKRICHPLIHSCKQRPTANAARRLHLHICAPNPPTTPKRFPEPRKRKLARSRLLPLGLEASQPVLDGIQDHVSVLHLVLHVTDLVVDVLGCLLPTPGARLELPIRRLRQRRKQKSPVHTIKTRTCVR